MTDKLSELMNEIKRAAVGDEKYAGLPSHVYSLFGDALAKLDEVAALENELGLAIPFVKMAGYADNSGEEYHPICQECESVFANHKDDCALKAWLERNKEKET